MNHKPIRSFTFTTNNYVWTKAELQAKVGDAYKTIRKFEIDRTNGMPSVGFFTNAPVVSLTSCYEICGLSFIAG